MTAFEAIVAILALLCVLIWGALGLLQYRTRRRSWDRHVDAALALGSRRPQDALNDARWPT